MPPSPSSSLPPVPLAKFRPRQQSRAVEELIKAENKLAARPTLLNRKIRDQKREVALARLRRLEDQLVASDEKFARLKKAGEHPSEGDVLTRAKLKDEIGELTDVVKPMARYMRGGHG